MKLYRDLSPEEIIAFHKWAREHYVPFNDICGVWHPVVQRECIQMNEEEFKREEFLQDHLQDNKADLL